MSSTTQIIVIGANGRMGRTLCTMACENPGFELVAAVDRQEFKENLACCKCAIFESADAAMQEFPQAIAIDFTAPGVAIDSAKAASRAGVPLVIGTTGFSEIQKKELATLAVSSPILWSANMSIGINALLDILPELARKLGPAYDMEIVELHHKRKKDAPSGTALMLGEKLADARGWTIEEVRSSCRDGLIGERPEKQIGIQALRGGDVVGVHSIYFMGPGEVIEIRHQAESRENFAMGALSAARWLAGKPGGKLYSMQDVIKGE